jgi:peptidoglycan hydrolase-like protein with peptidoglycan-binding domain
MTFVGAALPLHSDGLAAAAAHVGVDPATLWSVVTVETSGCGFLPDRRPAILFERHVFSSRTKRRFDADHPGISGPPGGYGKPGAHQYERLDEAIACDRRVALESASWGLGQVMGFNATAAGFRDAEELVSQMMHGETEQLGGMALFMRANGMHTALQRQDWAGFARRYNGPAFARNAYHEKLAAAYTCLSRSGLPDFDVRAVQLLLTYHGYNLGKIDGIAGGSTRAAIAAFTAKHGLAATADHKDMHAALLETLSPAQDGRDALSSPVPTAPRAAPAASYAAADLRVLQSLIEHLGWSPGPVDGKLGPRTRDAIAGFQQSRGVAANTEINAELLSALDETRRGFGRNHVADTRLVQRLLAITGFDPGDIDGQVGPRTRAAIVTFTRAHGGAPTDAIDGELLEALFAATTAVTRVGT